MKKHRINSDNHGDVTIPTTDYLELIEVYRAFNEKCFLVLEWGGKDIYAINAEEVSKVMLEQIASLEERNKALSKIIDANKAQKEQTKPASRWQFWK